MSDIQTESFLKYKSADIYFIYSFLIDFKESKYADFIKKLKKSGKTHGKWEPGTPDSRQGITPFLHIQKKLTDGKYLPLSFHKNSGKKSVLLSYFNSKGELYAEFPVDIEITTRLFFNGSGCATFKISQFTDKTLGKTFGLKEIKQILSLNRRMFLPEGHAKIDKKYLYEHFSESLNTILKESLLCSNVVAIDERRGGDGNIFPQNPNIFCVLELDEEEKGKKFWTSETNDEIRNKNKEVANILLQIIDDEEFFKNMRDSIRNIRIPPRMRNKQGLLKNRSWDYRIMTCINRNSSVLVTYNKVAPPAPFIEKSFIDIFEILRTRWHMNIVLNALLDHDIDDIKDKPSNENLKFLKKIIDRRKQYAYFLHDPLPYRYLGGSITDIIDIAESELWSAKLRDMTFRKFEVLDKLYEDNMRYVKIAEFDEYLKEIKKYDKKGAPLT